MTAEAAIETSRSVKPGKSATTADSLWPWYLITALYLIGCGIILIDRGSEFGEFFTPADGSPGRLRLNEIGDIAAGIFAPLAFLWLFVATQLQRRELRLQRAELSETRAVLAEQQRELERSAFESAHQTEIMRRTLDATMSRTVYDEFNLRLYFLAKIWMQLHNCRILFKAEDVDSYLMHFMVIEGSGIPTQENPTSIDNFFEQFLDRIQLLIARQEERNGRLQAAGDDKFIVVRTFHHGMPAFRDLMQKSETDANPLVQARVDGLDLESLIYQLEFLNDTINPTADDTK